MAIRRVVITAYSACQAENMAAALAYEPEILAFVGYGNFLSENLRVRMNRFFHIRGIETLVTEPVMLDRGDLKGAKEKLRKLFERHAEHQTVVDLSGADPFLSMLLGCAMGNRPDRMLETVFYDIREGGFYPKVRRRRWIRNEMPQLSLEELRYLQYGQAERVSEADLVYGRNDLTPELVREAPALTEMVAKDRAFWLETAERIRADIPAVRDGRCEFFLDPSSARLREPDLAELEEQGILSENGLMNGIRRIVFREACLPELLRNAELLPALGILIELAKVRRKNGKEAAFGNLALLRDGQIRAMYGCQEIFFLCPDELSLAAVCRFYASSREREELPVRRILVNALGRAPAPDVVKFASKLGIEIVARERLISYAAP